MGKDATCRPVYKASRHYADVRPARTIRRAGAHSVSKLSSLPATYFAIVPVYAIVAVGGTAPKFAFPLSVPVPR